MRTLPTGTTEQLARPRVMRARGFSLIEILVVVAIVGVTTGLVALSIHGRGERDVENAALRAQALVRLACEPESDGTLPQGLGKEGSDELRARPLGRDLALTALREGIELPLPEEPEREPAFACLASGELTPFVLRIERPDASQPWELEGHLDGDLTLQQVRRGL